MIIAAGVKNTIKNKRTISNTIMKVKLKNNGKSSNMIFVKKRNVVFVLQMQGMQPGRHSRHMSS